MSVWQREIGLFRALAASRPPSQPRNRRIPLRQMQLRLSMNHAQSASKSLCIGTALVLAALVVVVTGAAIPVQAQTYIDLHDFNASAGDPYNFL